MPSTIMWDQSEVLETVCDTVEEKIRKHHEIYRMPVRAEYIEDLLSQGMIEAGIGNDWYGGDHGKGADIFVPEHLSCEFSDEGDRTGISVKSNIKRGVNTVRVDISGSRLTRFNGCLESMLDYLTNGRNYDWYLLSTRRKPSEKRYEEMDHEEYELFMIPAGFVDPKSYKWEDDGDGYTARIEKGFHLKINDSQSAQYWIQGVPYEMIEEYSLRKIKVNTNEV